MQVQQCEEQLRELEASSQQLLQASAEQASTASEPHCIPHCMCPAVIRAVRCMIRLLVNSAPTGVLLSFFSFLLSFFPPCCDPSSFSPSAAAADNA